MAKLWLMQSMQLGFIAGVFFAAVGCRASSTTNPATPETEVAEIATSPQEEMGRAANERARPLRIEFSKPPRYIAPSMQGLKRGINLGNGFDAPSLGEWGVTPQEEHFSMAQAAGLDHIRLPVRFSAHAEVESPYTIDEEFFRQIDWAIERATAHELSIVIDLHHYEEIMVEPDAHAERIEAMWRQIAQRYQGLPETVIFELLNEPNNNLKPAKYNRLVATLVSAIRETNPTRTLIVDSFFWAAAVHLGTLLLPDDPHLVASFHMYQPILFTHQGADWMGPEYQTLGVLFPGPPQEPISPVDAAAQIDWTRDWLRRYNGQPISANPSSPSTVSREFEYATAFAEKSKIPVYLGEFGAIDFADAVSRENYLRLVRREAERRGFAWALWDDGGRYRCMKVQEGTWVEVIRRALFEDQPAADPGD